MPPKSSGGGKKSKAAKHVTNKRRRGFVDPDLKVSKRQAKKDDAKFVRAKFGNFQGVAPSSDALGGSSRGDDAAASSSSSDDEDAIAALGSHPKPARQRTHVFKTFARRVAEVDVDVHRVVGELRTAPLAGSSCFYHEALLRWAELNCGADFAALKAETEQRCQSLPLLVLHQRDIVSAIVSRLTKTAEVSLEAILGCLQSLARDLRGDFVPHLETTVSALAALVAPDQIGREPELLEHVFAALARICKWTQRALAADLPRALKLTRPLREHALPHVRLFAAQAVAFLLRAAPSDDAIRGGVDALLAEATEATEARDATRAKTSARADDAIDAAGALIAEASKGAARGLHSRAPRLLRRALRPKTSVWRSFSRRTAVKQIRSTAVTNDDDGDDDDGGDGGGGGASREEGEDLARLERAYLVAESAIASLAKHTRRGKCETMWALVLGAATRAARRVPGAGAAEGIGGEEENEKDQRASALSDSDDEDPAEAPAGALLAALVAIHRASASCGVVAVAVETYRGARVENYDPVFEYLKNDALGALRRSEGYEKEYLSKNAAEKTSSIASTIRSARLSLASRCRRLCLALIDSHEKVAGASAGPSAIRAVAAEWGAAVTHAPDAESAFATLDAMRRRALGGSVAARVALEASMPYAAPALARLVEDGWDDANGRSREGERADAAASLLEDVCGALGGGVTTGASSSGAATILDAAPEAAAAFARLCAGGGAASASNPPPARRRWALLRAAPRVARGAALVRAVADAIPWALDALEQAPPNAAPERDSSGSRGVRAKKKTPPRGASSYASDASREDAAAVLAAALDALAFAFETAAASEGNATAPAADVLDAFHEARFFSGVTGGASVKESPSTLAVRAARAAPECPAAVLAASRLLRAAAGAEASARPGVDAAASGRRADLSKSEEVRGGDETTENSSEKNTVNALSTALETHGSYLNAPSRHLRAATCAFLRDVERYVDRKKKVFDAAAEETDDVSDAAANSSATPDSLGAVFDRFHLVFARDPADASGTGVMAYAKAAQGAVRSAARLVGREGSGSGSGGKKGFPAEWAGPVAACALGAFRSRLATLWPEAITLVGAVTERARNRAAWDAVFAELEATQAECLRAHEEAAARVAAAESFSKKGERADDGVDASRGGGPKEAFMKGPSPSSESKGETAEGAPSPPSSGCALALQSKARAFAYPVEQGTERWTRLGLVLRSVAASPEAAARDPKPLALAFLAFDAPKPDGSRRGGRAYRAGLREWLAVHRDALGGGRKVRALEGGVGEGVRASLERCVSADEPATAQLAVRCLGQWRLPHLDSPELAERVARVAHPDTCRDELVGLSLSGTDAVVSAEHRPAFASLIVRALLPRLRKRSGKHAPLRAAALAWIGRLDAREIAPLIREVVQPLEPPPPTDSSSTSGGSSWSDALLLTASCGPGSETSAALWWDLAASEASSAHLERLVREGSKRPAGFLRAAADATRAMGEHVGAYLDPIATCATALLRVASRVCEEKAEAREKAAMLLSEEDGHPTRVPGSISSSSTSLATAKEAKEVRALAARLLASILARHPSFDVATRHWPVARDALAPMAARLAAEAGGASPPPALDVVAALAEDERLATLLLREEERASPAEEEEEEEAEVSKGVAKKREAELSAGVRTDDAATKPRPRGFLSEAWRALGAPSASPATRAAALAVAERLADQAEAAADGAGARGTRGARDDEDAHVSARLLRRTAPGLLAALQSALAARANPDANARARLGARLGPRGGGGTKGPRAPNNAGARSTERELAVLRRLGPLLGRDAASAAVADTLVPVLAIRRLDEKAAEEVLRALEAVLPAAGTVEGGAGGAGEAPDSERRPASDAGVHVRGGASSAAAIACARYRAAISPLFGRLRGRSARRAAVRALAAVGAAGDASARLAASTLAELHADAPGSVDGADYDRRLDAYDALDAEWFHAAPGAAIVPVARHALWELGGGDLALRRAAAAAIDRFLACAAEARDEGEADNSDEGDGDAFAEEEDAEEEEEEEEDAEGEEEKEEEEEAEKEEGEESEEEEDAEEDAEAEKSAEKSNAEEKETDASASGASGDFASFATAAFARVESASTLAERTKASVVLRVVAPGVRDLLRSPDHSTRAEALAAFRRLATTWPSAAPGAAALAHPDDPELDFFANASHLQAHRRCKALRRLADAANEAAEAAERQSSDEKSENNDAAASLLHPRTIATYLAPFAVACLGDAGADVASTAAATIGALAGALPFGAYREVLLWTLRKAAGHRRGRSFDVEGSRNKHIRAAATVLERFHAWDVDEEDRVERETGSPAIATNVAGRLVAKRALDFLTRECAPILEQLVVVEDNEGKGGTVRPAAARAVTLIMRLLPAEDLDAHVGRILGKIANCLRSRAQGVRDGARAALAEAAGGLGAPHLPRIVGLLTGRLDRGFMSHVLGATLHDILRAVIAKGDEGGKGPGDAADAADASGRAPELNPEDVEDALPEIMPVVDADVFGRAAEERDVASIRGAYREARRSRAGECLTLLASAAPCPGALPELLAPVTRRLHAADAPAVRAKLEGMLRAVSKGALANARADADEMLALAGSVVRDGVRHDERRKEEAESGKLKEMTLGEGRKGEKETGNRVWDNGWCAANDETREDFRLRARRGVLFFLSIFSRVSFPEQSGRSSTRRRWRRALRSSLFAPSASSAPSAPFAPPQPILRTGRASRARSSSLRR